VRDVDVEYTVLPDGATVAFVVFGSGPVDLLVHQNLFPIDVMWDLPQLAEFMDALGRVARVIMYDTRGQGASDWCADSGLEREADDLRSVLDAANAERVSVLDMTNGLNGVMFAATYPERVRSLIVAHLRTSHSELRALSDSQRVRIARGLPSPRGLKSENPRVAHDRAVQLWWGRARRLMSSPAEKARQMEWSKDLSTDSVLQTVRAPTLVLHRRDNRLVDMATSRALAARMPAARFVDCPGSESAIFLGETAPVLAEIERFLREEEVDPHDNRPLATVMFTDIVESTEQLAAVGDGLWRELLDEHDATVGQLIAAHRGRVVKKLGDGTLATFDGPARAVRCAVAIREAVAARGISVRSGLHTGEIELRDDDVTGIAVHIASRIATLAPPDGIVVSRTVVDLTAGAGISFEPRGDHDLKGVPGTWPLFAAEVGGKGAPRLDRRSPAY
jgi:class 3 adenylate cyclase